MEANKRRITLSYDKVVKEVSIWPDDTENMLKRAISIAFQGSDTYSFSIYESTNEVSLASVLAGTGAHYILNFNMEKTNISLPPKPSQIPKSPDSGSNETTAFPYHSLLIEDLTPKGQEKIRRILNANKLDNDLLNSFTKLVIHENELFTLDYFKKKEQYILYQCNANSAIHKGIKGHVGESSLLTFLQETLTKVINEHICYLYIENKVEILLHNGTRSKEMDILVAVSSKNGEKETLLCKRVYHQSYCKAVIQVKTPLYSITDVIDNLSAIDPSTNRLLFAYDIQNSSDGKVKDSTIIGWIKDLDTHVDGLFILCNEEKAHDKDKKRGIIAISRGSETDFHWKIMDIINERQGIQEDCISGNEWIYAFIKGTTGHVLAALFLMIFYATPKECRNENTHKELIESIASLEWKRIDYTE